MNFRNVRIPAMCMEALIPPCLSVCQWGGAFPGLKKIDKMRHIVHSGFKGNLTDRKIGILQQLFCIGNAGSDNIFVDRDADIFFEFF